MRCPNCQAEHPALASFCLRCGQQFDLPFEAIPAGAASGELVPTARGFRKGDLVLGRYRVTGGLGQGRLGVVYRCEDEVSGLEVALKALPREITSDPVAMGEVRDNLRLVARLVHQHILAIRTLEFDSTTDSYYA